MYRNDHDAALARIDALEDENERLRTDLERQRAPRSAPAWPAGCDSDDNDVAYKGPIPHGTIVGLVLALIASLFMCWALSHRPSYHHRDPLIGTSYQTNQP